MTDPRAAYLDCTAGVAGDMLLGALLDAGADLAAVRAAVTSLGVPDLDITVRAVIDHNTAAVRWLL